jgi:hypothetical protein
MNITKCTVVRAALALPVTVAAMLDASVASATVISTSSYVLDVDLTVAGMPASFGPFITASGANVSNTFASVSLPGLLSSSLLNASSSLTFAPTPTGTASATIEDLSVGLAPFLSLTATTISSESTVSGTGPLTATGATNIEDLVISGSLIGTPITFSGVPSANDVIFNSDGLTVALNLQVPSGDGARTAGIITDALAISFNGFPSGLNIVNGFIVVDNSQASITVPEPATWIEMLVGFGAIGFLALRARRTTERIAG